MKNVSSIIACILCFAHLSRAQESTLFITSAAAGTATAGNLEYTWTLGELAIDGTTTGSDLYTVGFHQGNLPFFSDHSSTSGAGVSTIITPNADGDNDVLNFPQLDSLQSKENNIIIFNRWGQVVFKTNNYNNDTNNWSGKDQNGKNLPEGTYYFVLFIQDAKLSEIHGNVLVIR
jgi:gliding motility-associated-like protein